MQNVIQKLSEIRKALVVIVGGLFAIAATFEISLPDGLTAEIVLAYWDKAIAVLAAIAGLVWAVPNKSPTTFRADTLKSPLVVSVAAILVVAVMAGCAKLDEATGMTLDERCQRYRAALASVYLLPPTPERQKRIQFYEAAMVAATCVPPPPRDSM